MAEIIAVIGAAAAIAQLLDYSRKIRRGLSKSMIDFQTLNDLAGQLRDMEIILAHMKTMMLEVQCNGAIQRCSENLKRLSELVTGMTTTKKNGFWARARLTRTWVKKEREILRLLENTFDREFRLLEAYLVLNKSCNTYTETAQASTLSPSITLPIRNTNFVGREDILRRIRERVQLVNSHTRLGIFGLGGIGKTQLVIELAHRLEEEDPKLLVLFLYAGSECEFECKFAGSERISGNMDPNSTCVRQVIDRFAKTEPLARWLLIVDGVDDWETLYGPKKLSEHLPRDVNGTIVFTSRNRDLTSELVQYASANLFHLDPFSETNAVELLTRISNDYGTTIHHQKGIVGELECLPLAVMQAATFIRSKPIGIHGYLELYRLNDAAKVKLLNFGSRIEDPDSAVMRTWAPTFLQIEKKSDYAAQLLCLIACLHPDAIPYWLLYTGNGDSQFDLVSSLGILEAYSFIRTNDLHKLFDMHSLVHFVLRQRLKDTDNFISCARLAFKAVHQHFPSGFKNKTLLAKGQDLIPHARRVLSDSEDHSTTQLDLGLRVSLYLQIAGSFADAIHFASSALETSRIVNSEDLGLEALSELALAHQSQGNYQMCLYLTEKVLSRRKQTLKYDHPDVLSSLNNLGLILQKQGRMREAESIQRDVLKSKEHVLGPRHDSTIKSLNNLALCLQDQERYKEAEDCLRKAWEVRQALYGTYNTSSLLSLNNLAVVLHLQDRFTEAAHFYSEAFAARKTLLGPKNHATLRSRGNMALNLLQQEEYAKAEVILIEVLESFVETLGTKHPDTLSARANLANAKRHLDHLQDAEKMYREVFEARSELFGHTHPDTVSCEKLFHDVRLQIEERRA